jgi:hypothetical protein
MGQYFDRYQAFRVNNTINPIPGIQLGTDSSSADKQIIYVQGTTRFDKLSQTYYQNPWCGWLIMLANQQYGGLEFKIPDQSIITIPFPFESGIDRYITAVNKYQMLYGLPQ